MLTLAEVLAMDVCRRGSPKVLAAAAGLDGAVRWVHAIELPDVARLLRGGELVLSTGIALPGDGAKLAAYVAELADAGAAGLAVELGRRYAGSLPAELVSAAEAAGLPLIAFEREVPFVEITEAVHARIIDVQLAELRTSERLHEMFTELSVAGASADEIVRQTATLAGRPVILADLSHRVLACEPAGAEPARLLAGFGTRSRAVVMRGRTVYDEATGWLVTPVSARGEDWGRVILVCDGPPAPTDTMLIERAATTLALGRLLTRHQESLERQAHRTLISGIIAQAHTDPAEAAMRSRALGVPVEGRQLLALVVRVGSASPSAVPGISAHARVLEAADVLAEACRAARVPALVGTLDDMRAGAMLSLIPGTLLADGPGLAGTGLAGTGLAGTGLAGTGLAGTGLAGTADPMLTSIAGKVRDRLGTVVIGVGEPAGSIRDVRRSFLEAGQVADVAADRPAAGPERAYYRLPDLHLRGLVHLLRDDPRLQTFVERELGALLVHERGAELIEVLAAYLEAGGNKASAAQLSHLARPTFYERLRRIERILGVCLDSAETRASLYVALLAHRAGPHRDLMVR
jgi:PucR family transcriptional regulator, purine catabolism regulatory protein